MAEKKTLKLMVTEYRRKHRLNKGKFGEAAGVHFTTVNKAEKGELDKDYSTANGQKKAGVARAISRLANACGEDPVPFLHASGLGEVVPTFGPTLGEIRERPGAIFNMTIAKDDLDYLLTVVAGLKQPLTLALVVELLRRREQASAE